MAYEAEEPGASAYNDSKAQSDRPAKKVYTGYMEMQTLDFDKASGDIDALVKELGGYFQQSSVSNRGNSGYRYGSYTIRIPSAQFDTFLQKAGTLCHLVYSSTGTDDVSETYYDTEARLETARIKLERLQALLAKATSMDDIITIESAISETEWDIENLSGTLRRYDALVDYATIDVELSEVYKLSGQDEAVTTFGGRLGQSFVNGLRAVGSALEDFAGRQLGVAGGDRRGDRGDRPRHAPQERREEIFPEAEGQGRRCGDKGMTGLNTAAIVLRRGRHLPLPTQSVREKTAVRQISPCNPAKGLLYYAIRIKSCVFHGGVVAHLRVRVKSTCMAETSGLA